MTMLARILHHFDFFLDALHLHLHIGSPRFFRRRKHRIRKCASLNSGIAQLALSTTNNLAASVGVEELIHQAMENSKMMSFGKEHDAIMRKVEDNIIGNDLVYEGPFGKRTVIYCDYTASGKAIRFIEDYIRDEVLPYYGNTHTTTTVSSLQTSLLRTEARQIIRKAMNCTDQDAVIFVSSGTTGAIMKLIHALDLKQAPVVFISPFEHHSNLLPWLEIGAEVVYGEENTIGTLDLDVLEGNLKKHQKSGRQLIGSFSAASNITGIMNDTNAIAILMHKYGGYAFFDYATAGPYLFMDMNPQKTDVLCYNQNKNELSYKDAIFCSIHKFVGGPGTPGLLVAKKHLFKNPVPGDAGGGTVLFVTHKRHHYLDNIEEREEGGTPAIVESIRAGLVFQLKEEVTSKRIVSQEHAFVQKAYEEWKPIRNIHILGPSTAERLPVFSLVIEYKNTKRMLHHNFVSALLNDLFGIQARGGCACAGPYAEDLLGMDSESAEGITDALLGNYSSWKNKLDENEISMLQGKTFAVLKPGFARLNLPYFMRAEMIDYILAAVVFIAEDGWKFLPLYDMDPTTGDFTHKNSKALVYAHRLKDFKPLLSNHKKTKHLHHPLDFEDVFDFADEQVKKIEKMVQNQAPMIDDHFLPRVMDSRMRWFLLPSEAHAIMRGVDPFGGENHYEPMFYPRADNALSKTKLQRTRLKSGLSSVKFCTCALQKKRHLRKKDCLKTRQNQNGECQDNNNGNINTLWSHGNDKQLMSPPNIAKENYRPDSGKHKANGFAHAANVPNAFDNIPGQVLMDSFDTRGI